VLATFLKVSTDDAPRGEAFSYWREIACYDWDPKPSSSAAGFRASAMGVVAQEAEYYRYTVSALEGDRSRAARLADGIDHVCIGVVLGGRRQGQTENDCSVVAEPGQPFVHDATRTSRMAWTDGSGAHLMIRRRDLRAVFGPELPPPSVLAGLLEASPLFGLWRQQMIGLGRSAAGLPAAARSFALGQLHRLTLFMLGQCRPHPLRAAALALVEAHLADPRLSPAWLAQQLGCSRATLYRAFGNDAGGIAALIADRRHVEARRRLAEWPHLPVAEVAVACGLFDTTNFSRTFRQRFGMSPGEVRSATQV
jgi:AraC-like DNA-binding protein